MAVTTKQLLPVNSLDCSLHETLFVLITCIRTSLHNLTEVHEQNNNLELGDPNSDPAQVRSSSVSWPKQMLTACLPHHLNVSVGTAVERAKRSSIIFFLTLSFDTLISLMVNTTKIYQEMLKVEQKVVLRVGRGHRAPAHDTAQHRKPRKKKTTSDTSSLVRARA